MLTAFLIVVAIIFFILAMIDVTYISIDDNTGLHLIALLIEMAMITWTIIITVKLL